MDAFWIVFGFAGQAVFGGAFVVQWIASEKRKRSHVPTVFWYLRTVGSVMLLVLACNMMLADTWKALPLVFGFSLNIVIYLRNLVLIYRRRAAFAGMLGDKNADTDAGAC